MGFVPLPYWALAADQQGVEGLEGLVADCSAGEDVRLPREGLGSLLGLAGEVQDEPELSAVLHALDNLQGGVLGDEALHPSGGSHAVQDFVQASGFGLGAHIVDSALAVGVLGDSGGAFVEVLAVRGKGLGALQVEDVAEQAALGFGAVSETQGVGLLRGQGVNLLGPDAAHLAQGARIAAQVDVVGLVHDAAHETGDQGAAVLHEPLQGLGHTLFHHVQHGGHDNLVLGEVAVHGHHIHGDVLVVEVAVILVDLVHVLQIHGGAAGVLQGPVVVPIEEDAHLGGVIRADGLGAQGFQFGAQLGALFEHPGLAAAGVGNHRAVELLAGALGAAQLEELDSVAAVGDGLVALGAHLARPLQGVVPLPVLLAGGLLHEHEGLVFQAAHQVVAHGNHAPGGVVGGIAIPGDDVHLLGPLEVIQALVGAHEVCGDGGLLVVLLDGVPLHFKVLQEAVGHEPAVINGDARKGGLLVADALAQGVGGDNLVPVVEGVAPELGVPSLVDGLDGAVLLLQPHAELFLAVLAVALAAILVADMPAGDVGVGAVALGQLYHQLAGVLLEDQAVGAMVVAVAKLMPAALVIHAGDLGVLLAQPSGHGRSGGGHDDVVTLFGEHVHDVVQLGEIVGGFIGLELCPGEHVDGGGVDARLLEEPHVLVPNLAGPLVGVVVAAVEDTVEGRFHGDRFLSVMFHNRETPPERQRACALWRRLLFYMIRICYGKRGITPGCHPSYPGTTAATPDTAADPDAPHKHPTRHR